MDAEPTQLVKSGQSDRAVPVQQPNQEMVSS
jgi:hypothetical protein